MTSKENIEVTEIEKKEKGSEETNSSKESEETKGSTEASDSEIEGLEEITEIELTEEQKKREESYHKKQNQRETNSLSKRTLNPPSKSTLLPLNYPLKRIKTRRFTFECASDCSKTIKISPTYLKAYYRRGISYERLEQFEESLQDFNKIKELNPRFPKLHSAIERITKKRDEKRQKDLEQMKSQLKNLGNTLLGKFGLSTDNFQVQKDPNSGSYSMQFKNN